MRSRLLPRSASSAPGSSAPLLTHSGGSTAYQRPFRVLTYGRPSARAYGRALSRPCLAPVFSPGAPAMSAPGGYCGGIRPEGPLEVRMAELRSRGAVALTRGFLGTLDQATVGDKILHAGKALDVVDFIQENQTQDLPKPWH